METNLTLRTIDADISPPGFIWGMLRNPLHTLADLARDNGDIAHVKMPKRDFHLLNHPEFIEEVLVKQEANFIKGPSLQRARVILGEGLLTSEGDEHLSQRRALQPAFHRKKMEEYLPVMGVSTFDHLTRWQHSSVVDMSDEMMWLTLNIALWSFFGSAPEGSMERVSEAMKTLIRLFPLAQLPLPEATRMLFPRFRQAKADLNIVTETLLANPHS